MPLPGPGNGPGDPTRGGNGGGPVPPKNPPNPPSGGKHPPKKTTGKGTKKPPDKKNKGPSDTATFYNQPEFDPRIYSVMHPWFTDSGKRLTRGYMRWDKPITNYGKNLAAMHFLFNPSTLDASYSLETGDSSGSLMSLTFKDPSDRASPRFPMQQSVSFSLLFDRTYELWGSFASGHPSHNSVQQEINDPHTAGVGVDILAMKQFTGMLADAPAGKGNNVDLLAEHYQGVMLFVPMWLFIGTSFGLDYYGFISSWDAQITHWTQYMVPMRCVIDVSMTLLPPPPIPKKNKGPNPNDPSDNYWTLIPPDKGDSGRQPVPPGVGNFFGHDPIGGPGGKGGR